jgi:medium-chain acyl-[acyl-carrier-protein] hydrolase
LIASAESPERWFPRLSDAESKGPAAVRLCCFPFAGGNAAAFAEWPQGLPAHVEVRALQVPGRADRLRESPIASLPQLLPILLDALMQLPPLPMVFFGHSNGALIAFELARALRADHPDSVHHLILSGKPAPHCLRRGKPRHALPLEELIEELVRFGGTPRELLEDREFMAQMLPMLRADFALSETHPFTCPTPVAIPTSLWCGRADESVTADEVWQWQRYVVPKATRREFDGGHFYIQSDRGAVLSALSVLLSPGYPSRASYLAGLPFSAQESVYEGTLR